jgi:hypothetical protein
MVSTCRAGIPSQFYPGVTSSAFHTMRGLLAGMGVRSTQSYEKVYIYPDRRIRCKVRPCCCQSDTCTAYDKRKEGLARQAWKAVDVVRPVDPVLREGLHISRPQDSVQGTHVRFSDL